MFIREIMLQPPAIVHQDTKLGEVVQVMLARQANCVAVIDDRGGLCGIISDEDFVPQERLVPFSTERLPSLFGEWMSRRDVKRAYEAARELRARDIMKSPAVVANEDDPVEEVLLTMQQQCVRCVPVVRDHVPTGMFSHHQMLLMMT